MLRDVGVSERDLAESDPLHHRMSAAGQSRLLDCAAEATEDTAFGLHLGEQTDPRDAGTIFYAMSASENIGRPAAGKSSRTSPAPASMILRWSARCS